MLRNNFQRFLAILILVIVSVFPKKSVGNKVTLCCPIGQHLDSFLSCNETSVKENDIRLYLSKLTNASTETEIDVLTPSFKPITGEPLIPWILPLDHDQCLDFTDFDNVNIRKYVPSRKVELNICCPIGQVLNTENDLCVNSDNSNLKIAVQPSNTSILTMSLYEIEHIVGNVYKPQCIEEDLSYLKNGKETCIIHHDCLNPSFYINRVDQLTRSGSQVIQESYPNESFCLAVDTNANGIARLCHKDPCRTKVCVTKCCPPGEYFHLDPADGDKNGCQPGNGPAMSIQIKDIEGTRSSAAFANYSMRYGIPSCDFSSHIQEVIDGAVQSRPKRDLWVLTDNASLYVASFAHQESHELYCIDEAWDGSSALTNRPVAVFCSEIQAEDGSSDGRHAAMGSLMIISSVFLALTIIIYLMLPELRNFHGISIVCYSFSMMMNFMILASLNLGIHPEIESVFCKAVGITAYYSFQASFSWLSVMGVDLYRTFRGSYASLTTRGVDLKTFAIYSTVGWGLPAVLTIVTIIMDNVDVPYYVVTPNFGVQSCWLHNDKRAVGIYLYAPVSIFLFFNICCFMTLAVNVYTSTRKEISLPAKYEKRGRERMWTIFKLFLLMGITWIFEILSWAIGGPAHIWYFTDAFNILKPVVIFVIFVCRRKVLDLLGLRYKWIGSCLHKTCRWDPPSRSPTASISSKSGNMIEIETNRAETTRLPTS